LEAHGTGTVVGDPIEVNAAAAVYGLERKAERPLLIGSVKTNIGHLGPAAGVAGLIKAVMAMKERVIPRNLNFSNPNPNLDWDRLPVKVTDQLMDWPRLNGRLPLAGVNSFGWSGTNAHLLVESYDTTEAELDIHKNCRSRELTVQSLIIPLLRNVQENGNLVSFPYPLDLKKHCFKQHHVICLGWMDRSRCFHPI
ncbi:MAG: polyketide synthase, partial [Gammaproteobacteria bacterium]|nr:polyketide synthase [Gammaproteobacteria bacterium]